MRHALPFAAALVVLASAGLAHAAIVPATIVYRQGDAVLGTTISSCNSPFTDSTGRMASIVILADTRRAILDEHMIVLFDSGTVTTPVLSGAEGTIGIGNAGQFIYSPSIDGQDGVFGMGGTILRGTDPAPGFPGRFSTFSSRPTMTPDGTAYWVGGTAATSGGATSQRVLYKCTDTTNPAATTSAALTGGDTYGGLTISAQGIEFGYFVSKNGQHRIHALTATGVPTTSDSYVAADDVIVAREGSPAPVGNWSNAFRIPGINNSGVYVLAGDTTNATTTADEIIISNSGMIMQEGTTIGGLTLSGTCNVVSINNLGDVAFTWGSGATEGLFRGPVASLMADAVKLLQVGDLIDTNNDGVGDFSVTDFEASSTIGPGLDLADDGRTFVEVTLTPAAGGAAFEAILVFGGGGPTCGTADFNCDGDIGTDSDIESFFACLAGSCPAAPCTNSADFNTDGDLGTDADIEAFFRVLGGGAC